MKMKKNFFEEGKEITVCDQACGTGGMLSTAYSYLKHYKGTVIIISHDVEFLNRLKRNSDIKIQKLNYDQSNFNDYHASRRHRS